MKLPWYVISKGSLLHHLPLIGKSTAQSLGPIILVPDPIYRNLQTDNPNPKHKEMGVLKFGYKYLSDSKFRFQEELLAVKEAMKYLKKNKIAFDFGQKAKFYSGYLYLWPVSKEYAEKELKKAWDEV